MERLRQLLHEKRLIFAGISIALAVILFNNWVMALVFNGHLFGRGGSVSELSVRGQPHALFFQYLDLLSAVFFIFYGILISKFMDLKSAAGKILTYGVVIFGIANVADALFVLPCAQTVDKNCLVPVSINLHHFQMPNHGYSSIILALLYFLLPAAGIYYSRKKSRSALFVTSLIAVAVALGAFASSIWQYVSIKGFTTDASGVGQGFQMLVLAAWFLGWYAFIWRQQQAAARKKPA